MQVRVVAAVALLLGAALLLAACSQDGEGGSATEAAIEAREPAALAVTPAGTLLFGERLTGRVYTVEEPYGATDPQEVVSVPVMGAAPDQRGLLGLAVGPAGAVYASYTRADDGRLVVAEVAEARDDGSVVPIEARLVWLGPQSAERANGGHVVVGPDGRVVIGIGDLLEADRVDDPDALNGKMLALDPTGGADQRPAVLSSGWNNPFAFTYDSDGHLWVADNAGPSGAERIGRGDQPGAALTELRPADDQMAPSALVALDDGNLGVCGFLAGRVLRVETEEDRAVPRDDVVTEPCRLGAVVLPDGRLAVADFQMVIVTPVQPEGLSRR